MNNGPIPSWHCFEILIRDALRPLLPDGPYGGLLMNRRLGTYHSTEADLLYGGQVGGDSTLIIVECKNRPLEVDGEAIFLSERLSDKRTDIVPILERKALDARNKLGFIRVRFLVVGVTQTGYIRRINSECLVVGQPVQAWIRNSNVIQQYLHLEEAWRDVTHGMIPLHSDSKEFQRLRTLPQFTPWAEPEAVKARENLLEEKELNSAIDYDERACLEELREKSRLLHQQEGDIDEGWYYPDD